jgi:hypothetical protein
MPKAFPSPVPRGRFQGSAPPVQKTSRFEFTLGLDFGFWLREQRGLLGAATRSVSVVPDDAETEAVVIAASRV